ncbi:MAG TPA: AEC family transporter [Desulfobulbaceae bacterium]|nr:AEC family transporter [Desulfobulbaceae bacterium]
MEQVLPFLLFLGAGLLFKQLPVFPADTDRSLNLYVIYIALPALILLQVPTLTISSHMLVTVLMPWAVVLVSASLTLLVCKLARWPREVTGALLMVVPLGNTSFFGIPMVEQFFGISAVSYAILYDQLGSFLALSTYGTLILAIYGRGTRTGTLQILIKIITFPPFIALTAALFLPMNSLLATLKPILTTASCSLVPVVLVAIGFQMQFLLPGHEIGPFIVGLLIRLLITPVLFLLACKLLDISGQAVQVSLFETAMPPMVTAGALASIAGLRPGLTSAMVGFGILFSFLTLPLIFQWIQ